jgi:hypothetical protein
MSWPAGDCQLPQPDGRLQRPRLRQRVQLRVVHRHALERSARPAFARGSRVAAQWVHRPRVRGPPGRAELPARGRICAAQHAWRGRSPGVLRQRRPQQPARPFRRHAAGSGAYGDGIAVPELQAGQSALGHGAERRLELLRHAGLPRLRRRRRARALGHGRQRERIHRPQLHRRARGLRQQAPAQDGPRERRHRGQQDRRRAARAAATLQ